MYRWNILNGSIKLIMDCINLGFSPWHVACLTGYQDQWQMVFK